jgi:GGDEF domain-containing protein
MWKRQDELGRLACNLHELGTTIDQLEANARAANPLTGLQGNHAISRTVESHLSSGKTFCVIYADLDNFKAFNDFYGIAKGDEVLRFTARALESAVATYEDPLGFVGHVGGDDFICVCSNEWWLLLCEEIIQRFDTGILNFYDTEDREKGYIETKNRRNEVERFRLCAISLAVVTNQHRPLASFAEVASIAAEMKKVVKSKAGSCYAIDQRTS